MTRATKSELCRFSLPRRAIAVIRRALCLPAVAPPAPTTTTAAAATTISTIAATSAATTSADAFCLGPRFVDVDGASADLCAVQRRDRLLAVLAAGHLDEAEAARTSGVAVRHDAHPVHLPVRLKRLAQFVFVGVEAEIPHKNILHASASALSCRSASSHRRTWQVGRAVPENRYRSWRTVNCGQKYNRFAQICL